MRNFIRLGSIGVMAAAIAFIAVDARAQGSTVQPVVVDLQPAGGSMSRVITVQNTSSTPMPVELRTEEIAFAADGPHGTGKDPGDLVVFPAQSMIAPGQTQTFRVQYAGDPQLSSSKHYYVTVAQLPVARADRPSAIQLLYNFRVMVSVQPLGGKPNLHVVSAQMETGSDGRRTPVVEIANDSNGYGYLSQGSLLVIEKDSAGREIFRHTLSGGEIQQTIGYGLIGARQTRKVALPSSGTSGGVSVDVRFIPQTRRF
jgi:fimbrial chaperone protein